MLKIIIKYLIVLSAITALAYIGFIWTINSKWLQRQLNNSLPLKAEWSELRINLFNGRVAIENLVVDTKTAGRLGTIRYLAADLNMTALLERKIIIDSVTIVGIRSDLSMIKIKDLQPPKSTAPGGEAKPKSPLDLQIKQIKISSLSAKFGQSDSLFYQLNTGNLSGYLDLKNKTYQLSLFDNFSQVKLPTRQFNSSFKTLSAKLVDTNIQLEPFLLVGWGYKIAASATEFDFSQELSLNTELNGQIFMDRLLGISQFLGSNNSVTSFKIRTKGEMNNPQLSLQIDKSKDQFSGVKFDSLTISAALDNRQLQLNAQIAEQKQTIGTLDLKLDALKAFPLGLLKKERHFEQLSYKLIADLKEPNRLSIMPPYLKQAIRKAHLSLNGAGVKPDSIKADLALRAKFNELTKQDLKLKNLDLNLNLAARQGGIYNIKTDLWHNSKVLSLIANYNRNNSSGNLELITNLDQSDSLISYKKSTINLKGQTTAHFNLENRPSANVNLLFSQLAWQNYRLDSLNLAANLDKQGEFRLDKAIVLYDSSSFKVKGFTKLFSADRKLIKHPFFDLQFEANNFRLNPWLKDAELTINGSGNLTGSQLEDLKGDVRLVAGSGKLWQQPIDSLKIFLSSNSKVTSLQDLTLKFPGGDIHGSAEIRNFQNYTADLKVDRFKLDMIPLLAEKKLSGALSIDLKGSGLLSNPQFTTQLKIADPVYQGKILDSINLNCNFANNKLQLDGDAGFKISATADLVQKYYKLNLNFADWNYARWLPDSTDSFIGSLNGTIGAFGKLSPFSLTSLVTNLDSIYLKRNDRQLVSGHKIKLFYDKSGWKIPENRLQLFQNGFLSVQGNGELGKRTIFGLNLSLTASEINAWLPDLEGLQGTLTSQAKIDILDNKMIYSGKVDLDNLGIQLPTTDQLLKNLNGKIRFDQNGVALDSLQGKLDNGSFHLGGKLDLIELKPGNFNFNFSATALPVTMPEYFDGHLNGILNYRGNLEKSQLSGSLDMLDFNYYRDIETINRLLSFRSGKTVKPVAKPWFGDKVGLNVTLNSRKPLILDNNLLYLALQPDLNIKGTVSHPELQGRATIRPGSTVEVINNQFVIKKGVLDFSPHLGWLPDLDLDCQTQTEKYKINVSATGNLAEPQISLTSIPPEQESDLISILLTGRKPAELSATSDFKTNKEKVAVEWLFNKFRREINSRTGLDYLDLKLEDSFSAKNKSGYGITVGKKLSDRLLVKYSVGNSNSTFVQKGAIEYQLLERFFFDGYQSTNGTFGGEIQFRNEFR